MLAWASPESLLFGRRREKMVEGRISKIAKTLALLEQPFIKDSSKTVAEHVKEAVAGIGENIRIRRFTRYNLGEVPGPDRCSVRCLVRSHLCYDVRPELQLCAGLGGNHIVLLYQRRLVISKSSVNSTSPPLMQGLEAKVNDFAAEVAAQTGQKA